MANLRKLLHFRKTLDTVFNAQFYLLPHSFKSTSVTSFCSSSVTITTREETDDIMNKIVCESNLSLLEHKNIQDELTEEARIRQRKNLALSAPVDYDFLNTVAPQLQKSFNFAPFVDKSKTLQQLIKLGVDLSVLEKKGTEFATHFLTLDLERDMKPYLQFLVQNGVPSTDLGTFITRNPFIFLQDISHLETRVKYLSMKGFTKPEITRIISVRPTWLNMNTMKVDSRLGYLQKEFKLRGDEVRNLIVRNPRIGLVNIQNIIDGTFSVREKMGFNEDEIRTLLLTKPKIWLISQDHLLERFDYLHNTMGISHANLVSFPGVLLSRKFIIQQRHEYLAKLGRAQYDPTKPNYVSLKALVTGRDDEFCWNVAKTTVKDFNQFLKSF